MRTLYWVAVWLLIMSLIFTACDGATAASKRARRTGQQIPALREFDGQQGFIKDFGVFVVQRAEVWKALWGDTPAPDIDFSQQTVLAAFMGQQSSAGYSFQISDVRNTGKEIVVYITQTRLTSPETATQVFTYPYSMVVIPKTIQPVSFTIVGMKATLFPVVEIFQGQQSLVTQPQAVVVRDQQAWEALWSSLAVQGTPMPTVDFSQYMAVAVLMGQRSTGGYGVAITSIARIDDRLTVNYRRTNPAPNANVPQVITSPYVIALIPRNPLPVAFHEISSLPSQTVAALKE